MEVVMGASPTRCRLWSGLDNQILHLRYGIWRAGRLADRCRSRGKYKEFSCGLTDGIDVVVVVPEDLADRIFGELSGIVRDGTAAVAADPIRHRDRAARNR